VTLLSISTNFAMSEVHLKQSTSIFHTLTHLRMIVMSLTWTRHITRQENYWLKNLTSCSMTNFGCSSGIQWPESGTVIPVTLAAKFCVDDNAKLPG